MKSQTVRGINSRWKKMVCIDQAELERNINFWGYREIILPYFDTICIHGGKAEVVVVQRERSSMCWSGWHKKAWPIRYSCRAGVLDIEVLSAPTKRVLPKLYINSPSIHSLCLKGSSMVQTKFAIVAESFQVSHKGDGELTLNLNTNRLETHCEGRGSLFLQGKTNYWKDHSGIVAEVNALALFVTVI